MRVYAAIERIIIISGFCLLVSFIFCAPKSSDNVDNIEDARQALNIANDGTINAAFFVPDDSVKKILLGLIENEKEAIFAAQFRVTDGDVVKELIKAVKFRNVEVRLIIDHGCIPDPYQKISMLIAEGIKVHEYYNGSALMHNKVWNFKKNFGDKPIVVTGSTNCTRAGLTKNEENMMVTNDLRAVKPHQEKFEKLYHKTYPLSVINQHAIIERKYTQPIELFKTKIGYILRLLF